MKRMLVLFGLLIATLALSACGGGGVPDECATDAFGCVEIGAGEPVVIGLALVQSGAGVDVLGLDTIYGAEVAIKHYGGEVLGHPIETVTADSLCNAEGGTTTAQEMTANPQVAAIIGNNCSSACVPSSEIYSAAGYSQISPSCTAPSLTDPATHQPFFLRTSQDDVLQGSLVAKFVYEELGLRTASTIHDGSPYAEQLQQVFADKFTEMGGTIYQQQAVNVGDTEFRTLLADIAADGPELLYYPIFPAEAGLITSQAAEVEGMENTILMGSDGMLTPAFVDASGGPDVVEGFYISGPAAGGDDPRFADFVADYEEIAGSSFTAAFHAHAYDAALMILEAINDVGIVVGDSLYIPRDALRARLFATADFDGLTGQLTCSETGDCSSEVVSIFQVQDGEVFNPVYP